MFFKYLTQVTINFNITKTDSNYRFFNLYTKIFKKPFLILLNILASTITNFNTNNFFSPKGFFIFLLFYKLF